MKNIIQKHLAAALVLAMIAAVFPARAFAGASIPKEQNTSLPFIGLDFIGAKAARAEVSTTAKLIVSGSGMLYSLCVYGTAAVAGAAAMAFDTNDASPVTSFAILNEAISPQIFATPAASGGSAASVNGCYVPYRPMRFEKGLVLKNSDASLYTLGSYRLDSGTNP